ncbi:hypothetical protein AGIG_G19004 [Arapaima gigas]
MSQNAMLSSLGGNYYKTQPDPLWNTTEWSGGPGGPGGLGSGGEEGGIRRCRDRVPGHRAGPPPASVGSDVFSNNRVGGMRDDDDAPEPR